MTTGTKKYSQPDPNLIERVRASSDGELPRYLENARRKLPDTQWLVDVITDELLRRGGVRNLNAESVRKVILGYARKGQTCTYKDIASELGVSWNQAHWRLPGLLGEVSETEHAHGRPLLTAIVVSQKGNCGSGFFELARRNGAVFSDQAKFQHEEQERVLSYWKEN